MIRFWLWRLYKSLQKCTAYEYLKIKIDDKIRDEKIQYSINREAVKMSALSSEKNYKYEYLTGE